MKSWSFLVLALAACDQVFSLDRPPVDAAPDGPPDAAIDAPPPCEPPGGVPSGRSLLGTYLDFSPTEDETLALVRRTALTAEYTENRTGAPFGASVSGTGIPGTWGRVVLSPEGDRAFLSNSASVIYTSARSGPPSSWDPPVVAGLPIGLPGRPSAGSLRMFVESGGTLQEHARSENSWVAVGPAYSPAMLGHPGAALTYASLSADGQYLLYLVPTVGTYYRVRGSDGTFGMVGARLTSADVRFPVLVNCRTLYVVSTAGNFPFVYTFPD